MKDCNEPVFKIISITKAIFSKRNQGAFVVKYPLCKGHERRRDDTVDSKKFKKANPYIVQEVTNDSFQKQVLYWKYTA